MTAAGLDISATYPGLANSVDDGEQLLEDLARGDARVVASVYDTHHSAIRAFSLRLLGDPAAAEDLVHEVFVTLPKAIRCYERRASLRTFLISIAVNHSRHYIRSAARRRAAMQKLAEHPAQRGAPETPEHALQQHELVRLLSEALDTLSVDHRVAFVLCEVEERSSKDAASIVNVPEATIRTRLFHAKKKLRAFLEKRGVR
jgi:RNA polymerase sigma-70 factor (ECF subfamily)